MNTELKGFSTELYRNLMSNNSGWVPTPGHDSMFIQHQGTITGIALIAYYKEESKWIGLAKEILPSDKAYQYHLDGIQKQINEAYFVKSIEEWKSL
jgi:hypothetical protein